MEVARELQEVGLLLHHDGCVPILEQVPSPRVAAIEGPRVARKEGAHAPRERPVPRPDQEVRMVREQGPGVDRPGPGLAEGPHAGNEVGPVGVVAEEGCPVDPLL